jgi:hypothetical protein
MKFIRKPNIPILFESTLNELEKALKHLEDLYTLAGEQKTTFFVKYYNHVNITQTCCVFCLWYEPCFACDIVREFYAKQIQRVFRGFLARQLFRRLYYQPGGPGYLKAYREFVNNQQNDRPRKKCKRVSSDVSQN